MTDIKVINGEIALGNSDFEGVEGAACVVQGLKERLLTGRGALFYDPAFGAGLKRFIQAPSDPATKTQVKALLMRAIEEEPRIVPESHSVKVSAGETLEASMSFEAFDNPEPINLTLRIGEELAIYEN